MDLKKLADDIINGKRLTRKDDLSFFIDCELDALLEGADKIREYFCGDKVDLCTIINEAADAAKIANTVRSLLTITQIVKYMTFFQKKKYSLRLLQTKKKVLTALLSLQQEEAFLVKILKKL